MKSSPLLARGFSIIEVMVTIVVVAFGLLGLASLVLRGLQASADSQYRTLAVKLAYDMADRLRSNPAGVAAGNYNTILPAGTASTCGSLLSLVRTAREPIVDIGSGTPSCSGTGATYDSNCWQAQARAALPNGTGAVCREATENWFAVIVSWDEGRTGLANRSFWITFEP